LSLEPPLFEEPIGAPLPNAKATPEAVMRSLSWMRFLPENRSAKATDSAVSLASAGESFGRVSSKLVSLRGEALQNGG
jgi:hypothetical protein